MTPPIHTDIYIAAQCADTAIDAAVGDLALIPCPNRHVEQATIMLIIAHDYLSSIMSLSAADDGSTTTPDTASDA